jgi:hypothetical protein
MVSEVLHLIVNKLLQSWASPSNPHFPLQMKLSQIAAAPAPVDRCFLMAMAYRHLARRWGWSSMRVTGHNQTATGGQSRRADGDGRMRATPLRSQPHCTAEPSVGPAIDATASLQYFLVQRGKGQSGWNVAGRRSLAGHLWYPLVVSQKVEMWHRWASSRGHKRSAVFFRKDKRKAVQDSRGHLSE